MRRILVTSLALAALLGAGPARANGQPFGFDSLFGGYNEADLQTGFAVYQANCASCHGVRMVRYRDLQEIGLSQDDISKLIAGIKLPDGTGKNGKPNMVKATPDDRMVSSYPDAKAAAAANHGAVPPDLSLFEAGRENGAEYVQSLLLGYRDAPSDLQLLPNHYDNIAYPGGQIAMPPSLKQGSVTLADGKHPSQAEMAHDVAEFLAWTASPKLEDRKVSGLGAILFLLVLGGVGAATIGRKKAR